MDASELVGAWQDVFTAYARPRQPTPMHHAALDQMLRRLEQAWAIAEAQSQLENTPGKPGADGVRVACLWTMTMVVLPAIVAVHAATTDETARQDLASLHARACELEMAWDAVTLESAGHPEYQRGFTAVLAGLETNDVTLAPGGSA